GGVVPRVSAHAHVFGGVAPLRGEEGGRRALVDARGKDVEIARRTVDERRFEPGGTELLAKILEARIGCVAKEVAHLVVRLALGRLRLEVSLASEDLAHDGGIPGASDASRPVVDRIGRGIAKKLRSAADAD